MFIVFNCFIRQSGNWISRCICDVKYSALPDAQLPSCIPSSWDSTVVCMAANHVNAHSEVTSRCLLNTDTRSLLIFPCSLPSILFINSGMLFYANVWMNYFSTVLLFILKRDSGTCAQQVEPRWCDPGGHFANHNLRAVLLTVTVAVTLENMATTMTNKWQVIRLFYDS